MDTDCIRLIVPGLGDSDEHHWQSLWESQSHLFQRVQQDNWDEPILSVWLDALCDEIERLSGPAILIGHSVACALIAHWSGSSLRKRSSTGSLIKGAMLVSPADVDAADRVPKILSSFAPMPIELLPFPSVVVASDNDPYVSQHRAKFFADCWGSEFISAGSLGHINSVSGQGAWPEGMAMLTRFIDDKN